MSKEKIKCDKCLNTFIRRVEKIVYNIDVRVHFSCSYCGYEYIDIFKKK